MNKPTIGITIGDPAGIGPEVTLKALSRPNIRKLANFLIISNNFVLHRHGAPLPHQNSWWKGRFHRDAKKLLTRNIQILDLDNIPRHNFHFGKINSLYGKASIEYIDEAVTLIKRNQIDGLVTAPVSKEAINLAGISFSGHTEYLAEQFKVKNFAMMLLSGNLKVVLVTRHLALNKVSGSLNCHGIIETIKLTFHTLKKYFKIDKPRIGVCSLNPHGGEGGILGDEEERIIKPAILKARIDLDGPLSADILFYKAYKGQYDCVIAMYHDQGIVPLKMVTFEEGVNFTLGLPFIRTSPLHGTGFNIAGKGIANPQPMIEAIRLVCRLVNH